MNYVFLGGGTGSSVVLKGLHSVCDENDTITAVLTTADDGGSSGIIREELKTPAFGDIRHALESLVTDNLWHDIIAHRFKEKEPSPIKKEIVGHVVGNFIITALQIEYEDRFIEKLLEFQRKIGTDKRFKVLPVTQRIVDLKAIYANGAEQKGESLIGSPNTKDHPLPIKGLFIVPDNARIDPYSARAIEKADFIIIGPGSTYTSILAVLIVNGVEECLQNSRAKKIIITNIMTQPGETSGIGLDGAQIVFTASQIIKVIESFAGIKADFIICNTQKPSEKLLKTYTDVGQRLIENDLGNAAPDQKIFFEDLVSESEKHIRHNPIRLGWIIKEIVEKIKAKDKQISPP